MAKTGQQQIGLKAENEACNYLQQQGLQLLERNYRCRQGEIDLIMRHADYLVFVEVRCRNNRRFSSGAESVDHRKQQKLIATASHYLQHNSRLAQHPARFDVVAMGQPEEGNIHWIQDAFQVT